MAHETENDPPRDVFALGPTAGRPVELTPQATPPRADPRDPGVPAPSAFTTSAPRPTPGLRVGRTQLIVALVAVVALAAGVTWWSLRASPVELAVKGLPIGNAQQVLDTADPVFRAIAGADGAAVPADAGCWFAPAAPGSTTETPRVACGPVALGIAGNGQRWLVGDVSYSAGPEQTTGRFGDFRGVADLDPAQFSRPDGVDAPDGSDLAASTAGVRTVDGRLLTNADATIADADTAFAGLTDDETSVSADSRCYLGVTVSGGRSIADGTLLCGPVLLRTSDPADQWATWTYSTQNGDLLVDATITSPNLTSLTSTVALPAGVTLWRPDGAAPPADPGLSLPDAAPQQPGYTAVLDEVLTTDAVALTAPTDGRLNTPALSLDLTGVATAAKIGSGKDALVAADGEELVVATFTATRPTDAPAAGSTPSLLVDGRRQALPSIRLDGEGTLIASVPAGARDVSLDLLTEGRSASISLLTGRRPAGSPVTPYRDQPVAGQSLGIAVNVALPAGDPLTATGAVTGSALTEWTKGTGYAPAGYAVLSLTVSQWQLARPCCDVSDISATVRWSLLLPDGTSIDAQPAADASSTPAPVFLVPESVTRTQLVVDVGTTFAVDGVPGAATGTSGPLDLTVPS